jgi:A/G-specific adenine glycosylase
MKTAVLADRLLDWYGRNARSLPWRGINHPYAVWVSEVMLQQTRVDTVIPYFERWLTLFPDIVSLAQADQQSVLAAWEGLGYYSRARSLHKGAQSVVEHYAGVLPHHREELERIPGIGPYTAGAIASIAFGLDEAALDGNIRRVYARVFAIETPLKEKTTEAILWAIALRELPSGRAGDYNQALMDLGATICSPHNPLCPTCPIEDLCAARKRGLETTLPVIKAKVPIPHTIVTAGVLRRSTQIDGKNLIEVLICQRPESGLLGGMWEFPGGKQEELETLQECLHRELKEELGVDAEVLSPFGVYNHAYTHFKVTLHAFTCKMDGREPLPLVASQIRWTPISELTDYPMGKIDRQIARRLAAEKE